jgi:Ca2+-binding RTX toxin-like protein
VTNVNEAPTITSNGGGASAAISVAENSTAVTTVTATDPDAGATLTFSLAGADASKFTINAATGALSFITAPDFEAPTDVGGNNVYDVLVQASDGSLIDTQAIAVTVTNVAGVTITGTTAANTVNATTTVPGQPLPTNEEDIIFGLGGADSLSGLGGNDTITGGTGNDVINAGAGNDLILYTIGDGADTVIGDLGLDTLKIVGTAAADTFTVAFDGTVLTGFAGGTLSGVESITADLLGGSDTLSYGTTTAAVTVNLATNSASGFASIAGIENVTGGAGADTLIGDGLANALNGGNGNDTLIGGLGVDTLTGGAGVDTVSYVGETDALVISLATGTTQRGSAAAPVEDVLVTIENVIGGLGSDSITGSTGNNVLDGGAGLGNDSIDGGSGNDTLLGGDGNDQLLGGVGTDSIDGGAGNDTIVGGTGNDTLLGGDGNDSFSYAFGDGVDTYSGGTGADALSITGTAANNTLSVVFDGTSITSFTGGTITSIESISADLAGGTDTLSYAGTTVDVNVDLTAHTASGFASLLGVENVTGGTGNDTLTGDAAANILAGGVGNDTYFVGAGDTVTEGAGAGTDTVNSTVTFTLGANVENLNLTALASINGTGNALANVIADTGGGNNVLSGLGGNDTITGGAGDDTMSGGTGNDVFVFHSGFGNDVITDFDANPTGGQDLLDISAYALTAATFAAHVSIVASSGNTLITIDGTDHFTLVGVNGVVPNLITSQDFIL